MRVILTVAIDLMLWKLLEIGPVLRGPSILRVWRILRVGIVVLMRGTILGVGVVWRVRPVLRSGWGRWARARRFFGVQQLVDNLASPLCHPPT